VAAADVYIPDAPPEVLDLAERANQGNEAITAWCPTCNERTVPMRNGLCGFCDTALELPIPAVGVEPLDGPDEWPHTDAVVRRQVVTGGDEREGTVKRRREGDRAHGPILAAVPDQVESGDDEPERGGHDPREAPILDWLEQHGKGTSTAIAEALGRKPANVATRLRQYEQAGFIRRTGRTVPSGRGGPMIEWELASETKPPTSPEDVLTSPLSPDPRGDEQRAMRRAYFATLLNLVAKRDCPEHIFDRAERLAGV
jgi:hypothetical protein